MNPSLEHAALERSPVSHARTTGDYAAASLAAQKDAFQAAMNGASLADSLDILVAAARTSSGVGTRCAFFMANDAGTELHHVTGMGETYGQCVDGFRISKDSLACGLAVYSGEPILTPDVQKDPRWRDWVWLAEQFGYRGLCSFPIETAAGKFVGTFAMYFDHPRTLTRRDLAFVAELLRAAAIIISRAQEINERKRAEAALVENEARQRILVAELQHRTRNIMAVVASIADSSLACSSNLPDFADRFNDHLEALARVQGLLSRLDVSQRITFDMLLESEFAPLADKAGRVTFEGPKGIALRSLSVQTFALALHELATNAIKHGGLSDAGGQVRIAWHVEEANGADAPWLHVDWRETGVRMSSGKERRGSGRDLIEQALPYQLGARVTYEMSENGVHCTIGLPVAQSSSAEENPDAF